MGNRIEDPKPVDVFSGVGSSSPASAIVHSGLLRRINRWTEANQITADPETSTFFSTWTGRIARKNFRHAARSRGQGAGPLLGDLAALMPLTRRWEATGLAARVSMLRESALAGGASP